VSPDPFTAAAARAKTSIEAKGRRVEFYKVNRTPDDPTKPWLGTTDAPHASRGGASISVIAVFVPAGQGRGGALGKLATTDEGRVSVAYEQECLVAADSIPAPHTAAELLECDRVRDGSQVWTVAARGELKPAGRSVLFSFALSR